MINFLGDNKFNNYENMKGNSSVGLSIRKNMA